MEINISNFAASNIQEAVYDSLMGQLIPEASLPWVEPIFVPEHPCYEEYSKMREAYDRLLTRLEETDEDRDAEAMIDALLSHGRIIALKMFEYGRVYQKMLDSNKISEDGEGNLSD